MSKQRPRTISSIMVSKTSSDAVASKVGSFFKNDAVLAAKSSPSSNMVSFTDFICKQIQSLELVQKSLRRCTLNLQVGVILNIFQIKLVKI